MTATVAILNNNEDDERQCTKPRNSPFLKEQARIKELNARLFRTKRDTDRLSAAIEDVEKSNLALMHRIRGKSLEKSPDALKREQKVKEAKETQKGAESRLRDAVRAHDGLDQELRALEDALEKFNRSVALTGRRKIT